MLENINKYDIWSVRTVTGTDKLPQLTVTKELRNIGVSRGDKVVIGVVGNKIEITKL